MSIALGMGATEAVASLAADYGKHVVIVCRPTIVQTMRRLVFKHNPTNWATIRVMSPATLRQVGDTLRKPNFLIILDFPYIRPSGENMHWYNWLLLFSKRTLLIARY